MGNETASARFGSTRGEYAMILVLTICVSFMLPGGGMIAALLSLLTGVRGDRRRIRTVFIVAGAILVLQIAFVVVDVWGGTEVCSSFDDGPVTCSR